MEEECIHLCNAMNAVKGICTTSSCCGHGKEPLRIHFDVDSFRGLFFMTRCSDKRYCLSEWIIYLVAGDMFEDGRLPTTFVLESKSVGEEAYRDASDLINNMNAHINHENFMSLYEFTLDDFEYEEQGTPSIHGRTK